MIVKRLLIGFLVVCTVLALAGDVSAIEASVSQEGEISPDENWNYDLTNSEKQPAAFNIQNTGGLVIDIDTDSQLLKSNNTLNWQSFNVQPTEINEFHYRPIEITSFDNIDKPKKDDSYT